MKLLSLNTGSQGTVKEIYGIPPEDQKQLFEPFHRGGNVLTIPGTGLRLGVVKKCVDLHQGAIQIVSAVGQGPTRWVTLPLS